MGWYGEDDEDTRSWWCKAKFFIERIPYYLTTRKCLEKGCKRRCKPPLMYCSYTCAAYDGVWGVKTGWKHAELKSKHPEEWLACHLHVTKKLKEQDENRRHC